MLRQKTGFLSSSWHIRSRGMFAGSCIAVICLVLALEFLRRVGREYDAFIVRRARLRTLYLSDLKTGPVHQQKQQQQQQQQEQEQASPETAIQTKTIPKAKVQERNFSSYEVNSLSSSSAIRDDVISPVPAPAQSFSHAAPGPQCTTTGVHGENHCVASDCMPLSQYRPSPVEQIVRALLHMLQFAVAYFVMLLAMYFNGYIIVCIFIGAFLGSLIFSWEPVSLSRV